MKPICELTFDGASSDLVTNHLKKVTIVLNSGSEPDTINVSLADPFGELPRPREGAKVFATLGYAEGQKRKFGPFMVDQYGGSFDENEGEVLTITGTSVDFRSMVKDRKTATHKNKSLREILTAEAKKAGIDVEVADGVGDFVYDDFFRGEKSFYQMVGELAETHDAIEKYSGNKLVFLSRNGGIDINGGLLAHSISRDDLRGWSWTRDFQKNYGGVKASYRDHDKGNRVVKKTKVDPDGPFYEIRSLFPDEKTATLATQSKAKQLQRAKKKIHIVCKTGDINILEQVDLTIEGVSKEVDQPWITTSATHEYDAEAEGYTTEADCETKA